LNCGAGGNSENRRAHTPAPISHRLPTARGAPRPCFGTDNQTAEVRHLALARGYEPVVFEEMESAVKARPVLDAMLADLLRELSRLGVRILSVREPWTDVDGPARELLAAVMAWVSGFERTAVRWGCPACCPGRHRPAAWGGLHRGVLRRCRPPIPTARPPPRP